MSVVAFVYVSSDTPAEYAVSCPHPQWDQCTDRQCSPVTVDCLGHALWTWVTLCQWYCCPLTSCVIQIVSSLTLWVKVSASARPSNMPDSFVMLFISSRCEDKVHKQTVKMKHLCHQRLLWCRVQPLHLHAVNVSSGRLSRSWSRSDRCWAEDDWRRTLVTWTGSQRRWELRLGDSIFCRSDALRTQCSQSWCHTASGCKRCCQS